MFGTLPAALCCVAAAVGLADPPLDELFAEYRALGLPVPHPGSRLLKYRSGGGGTINGEKFPLEFSVQIADPPAPRKPGEIFPTDYRWPPDVELAPDPRAVGDLGPRDDATTFAVRCYALGWDRLAQHYYRWSVTERYGRTARECLGQQALLYWTARITDPDADRRPVPRRLASLLEYVDPRTVRYTRLLIPDLERALVTGKGKPGTVEALIDDLVNYTGPNGTFELNPHDELYWRVVRKGFDAVPAVIASLDDDRLTRCMMSGFNNFWPWHMRVKHVTSQVLDGFAGDYVGKERNWMSVLKAGAVKRADAETWWATVKNRNEEAFFLDRVFKKPLASDNHNRTLDPHALVVLIAKYPKRIPEVYAKSMDPAEDHDSGPLAQAVVATNLPREEKIRVLLAGAGNKKFQHAAIAVEVLLELEPKLAADCYVRALDALPPAGTAKEKRHTAAIWAYSAAHSTDPRVWASLHAAARRVGPDVRAIMILASGQFDRLINRPQRIRFYLSFFNDSAEFDGKLDFDPTSLVEEWPKYGTMQIRNAAAHTLADHLRFEIPLEPKRTPAEWATVREKVRAAAEKELNKLK